MNQKPVSRTKDLILQNLGDEVLVYDLQANKAYCLNQTSAMIWHECDGDQSIAEISNKLSRKLKSNVSEDIVWLAVSQFKADKLLESNSSLNTPFEGLSRRDVMKRIGFASMIALPMVASVVAPTSAQAQSTACFCGSTDPNSRPPGCSCTSDTECCSGVCFLSATCQNIPPAGPACCPPAASCGAFPLAPGCLCLNNGDCSSGSCISSTCQI